MKKQKRDEFTDEFSFMLKPAKHGIGVFAVHNIKKGVYLRLFGNENRGKKLINNKVIRNKKDVPKTFFIYCVNRKDNKLICPNDFGHMPVGWYLNHSAVPNAVHRNYHYYSSRKILAGEEILIDYNSLE